MESPQEPMIRYTCMLEKKTVHVCTTMGFSVMFASSCDKCVCIVLTLCSQQRPASVMEPSNRCPAGVRHTQGQPRSKPLPLRNHHLADVGSLQSALLSVCL